MCWRVCAKSAQMSLSAKGTAGKGQPGETCLPFVPGHAVPCRAISCRALPCLAELCLLCLARPCQAMPCHAVPAVPCHAVPCCPGPCRAVWCIPLHTCMSPYRGSVRLSVRRTVLLLVPQSWLRCAMSIHAIFYPCICTCLQISAQHVCRASQAVKVSGDCR